MGTVTTSSNLISGRVLARSTVWNLVGQLLPAAIGACAIPFLIRGIGIERFGLLSLAWVVVGYFSLFDLGIGRALTKLVADKVGSSDHDAIPGLVWTSLALLLALGLTGGLVAFAFTPWLVRDAFNLPFGLQREAFAMFYMLAAAIPLITTTSGLRGILEALQRFRVITLIRFPISVLSFVGPLLVLPFSHNLVPMISVLLLGRIAGAALHLYACLHAMPSLRRLTLDLSIARPVIKFGGWMTVSNLVSPIMVYMDRFVIGSLLSVSAIAYYTAPLDMITRLLLIPGAIVGVLFPALAVSLTQRSERTTLLLARGEKYIFMAVFPIILIVVTLAPEALHLWLGDSFARNGTAALRWLASAVFVNSLAQVPYVLIQSAGRPDITAKIQLGELPFYLSAVWLLTVHFGVAGTAIAWAARSMVDAVLMFFFANRLVARDGKSMLKLIVAILCGLLTFIFAIVPNGLGLKFILLTAGLALAGLATWTFLLDQSERVFISRRSGEAFTT